MPIYEYTCGACRHEFEKWVPTMNGRQRTRCPECGGFQVERRLSVFAAREGHHRLQAKAESGCGRPQCAGGQCQFPT